MLINYLINSPDARVQQLHKEVAIQSELKRQHLTAIKYRAKRFAATKVGLVSAFSAGVVVESAKGDTDMVKKYSWLVKLLA
ncbi:hypothetical protein FHG08_06175 [Pseudoalteromonas sp. Scap03]|uniref:hypothetical protein n=1 Tax=unclassified Pseudoalteromonas TaxID=194690 RepID=UPI0015BFD2FF|nr:MULTISPECIES: hypothetical protein [unclassified Pseudoalteromonas]NWL15315.1 hypothetical protein [Pseudoalteromonas sp. Scap03]QLE80467.1 hypothetical protein FLM54_02440 [Pseudoalteromonas sp. Scap25]QLE88410.1 hypothetical protein FLM47_02440 [Pseudoalteromonas sp. Scap06]